MPYPLRALVIADDLDLVAILEYLAGRSRWTVRLHAVDGVTATGLLRRDASPDLIILDLDCLRLGGPELLSRVRDDPRFRRTAVVVTGATQDPGTKRQGFLPGEVWISKPFDVDDLLTAVMLAQARSAEHAPNALTEEPSAPG